MTSRYDLHLPVYKQGDDLSEHLEQQEKLDGGGHDGDHVADAFEELAQRYEEAAAICRRIVGVAREVPGLEVDADCHYIAITGPWDRLDSLVNAGLLSHDSCEDEEREGLEEELEGAITELLGGSGEAGGSPRTEVVAGREDALTGLLGARNRHWEGVNPAWVLEVFRAMVTSGQVEVTPGGTYRLVDPQ
jgi:hypothetical protein